MFTGTATPKLGLPQWNPTDHPDFLTDLNQAFKDIDENANVTSEEIVGYPQRLEELETLTQSLNEDTQQLIADMSSAQVAIANLKTESEKIDPMELQIQGLQNSVGNMGNDIDKTIAFLTTNVTGIEKRYTLSGGNTTIEVAFQRFGNIIEASVDITGSTILNTLITFKITNEQWEEIKSDLMFTDIERIFGNVYSNKYTDSGNLLMISYFGWNSSDKHPNIYIRKYGEVEITSPYLYPACTAIMGGIKNDK